MVLLFYRFKVSLKCVLKVTNIRVAADSREHSKRTEEEEESRLRKERIEQETKSATEKFEEVKF